jgi:hypothetical protein
VVDLQGEAESGEDADGEENSAVVAAKGQSGSCAGVAGGRGLGSLGSVRAAGSGRGSLGSVRAGTRASGRGSGRRAGGRAAAGAVIGVANELGTALGGAADLDAVTVVGVVVHALVDVFAALVGGEGLFVAGDVGAHAVAGADARVGEGVLGMPLVCALNGRMCDEEMHTGSQTLPPASVAPSQMRGQFWV